MCIRDSYKDRLIVRTGYSYIYNSAGQALMNNAVIGNSYSIRVSELAYAVGFNDPKYFSACFKKEFGVLPSEYLDQFVVEKEHE